MVTRLQAINRSSQSRYVDQKEEPLTANQYDHEFLLEMGISPDSELRLELANYLDTLYWDNVRRSNAAYFWRNVACVSVAASVAVLIWALI